MPKLGLPCLLNFADQAGWAKLGRRWGFSDQKTEMGFIIRAEKLSFWESARKIHDVAGTPNMYSSKKHKLNMTLDDLLIVVWPFRRMENNTD